METFEKTSNWIKMMINGGAAQGSGSSRLTGSECSQTVGVCQLYGSPLGLL